MKLRELARRLPSHGTVVAYIALFIALGGVSAYAAATIGSSDIKRNAVKSKHVKDNSLTGTDVNESQLLAGGVLTSRFNAGDNTFDVPNTFGPVSGFAGNMNGDEAPVQMVSPGQDMIAGDMYVFFDFISNNGGRRLTLRVDGTDTGLTCETTANFASASCSPPEGTETFIPAGSKLSWKTDRGSAAFNTAGTVVRASLTMKPAGPQSG
jgi:hypothetical protein